MEISTGLAGFPGAADRGSGESGERVRIGGEWVRIRRIRPSDATAHREFVARLTPEDLRFRFFTGVHALPDAEIARFAAVDHENETAVIAVREADGDTVGVARLIRLASGRLASGRAGEFAIVVQPDMRRQGLGRALMACLIPWARTRGITEITGLVLAENAEMLKFLTGIGFHLRREPEAPDVVEARFWLDRAELRSGRP